MTDPSTPQTPKSRRNKGRDTQTIDLSATVIPDENDDATAPEPVAAQETAETAYEPRLEDPAPSPEATSARKSSGGSMVLTGIICGLLGGAAGAALVLALQKPATTIPPAFEARITALEATLKEPKPESPALIQRLGTAEAGQQALQNSLKAINAKVDALAEATVSTRQDNSAPSPEIEQHLNTLLDAQVKLADNQRALAPLAGKLDAMEKQVGLNARQVDALEKQVVMSTRQAVDPLPAVRYALVTRLDQAVASGKPFVNALDAALKSGVAEGDVAALAPFTITGAPTAAQLKAEFKPSADAIITQDRSQSGETFTDKVTRMSKSVLRIRPSGDAQGSDPASLIVRIEAALDRGAFTEAAQIWNALPDTARQLSAAWGKRISDRAKAASALAALNDKTITALEGSVR